MACWWRLGLACCVEVAWWVSGVLRVVLRQRGGSVGSWCAVMGWRGGLVVAAWRGRMEVAHVHEWPAISRVLHAVLGQQGGLAVAGCQGRMEVARVHEWPATSRVCVPCLGGTAGWRWRHVASHVRALWGWSVWNNGVVEEKNIKNVYGRNRSTTHIPTPQIKPLLNTT
ncbi:hypothetical protein EDB83DRAFT_2326741 [Lactarius deliciosus]|nr:hypothetical protein EDB83DRAFT_2326741 [Lactarius deliciosus]